ncbi:hypothetical protein ABT324_28030 [Saccharopolyspora sp. NPDC000359]|uniref:hypothetical protein n=1 Tax=Saccharopolyspora sp. NPDC000359 TaxID=3154251 RepID=UPI003331D02F
MSAPTTIPAAPPADLPTDLLGDTLVHEGLAESLNALLEATAVTEQRRVLAVNAFGQWCTKDALGGWQPHRSYMAAYEVAHAEEVA